MSSVERRISLEVDGTTLAGTSIGPARGTPGFLLITGWEETHEKYVEPARDLYAAGFTCLTADLRGLGPTADQHETVTRAKNMADVLAAYDRLAALPGVDDSAIAVAGTSYGGYLAALLTQLRPVRWLALRVPALYRDEDWTDPKERLGEHGLDAYRHKRLTPDQNAALAACARFEGEVLLVSSGGDEIVPPPVIANYRAAFSAAVSLTCREIGGADHGLSRPEWTETYRRLLVAWAEQALRNERRGHLIAAD